MYINVISPIPSARVMMTPNIIASQPATLISEAPSRFQKITTTAATGVEMEALTAVSLAALTVYDMCKALDKGIEIREIMLQSKTGGKSGDFVRARKKK